MYTGFRSLVTSPLVLWLQAKASSQVIHNWTFALGFEVSFHVLFGSEVTNVAQQGNEILNDTICNRIELLAASCHQYKSITCEKPFKKLIFPAIIIKAIPLSKLPTSSKHSAGNSLWTYRKVLLWRPHSSNTFGQWRVLLQYSIFFEFTQLFSFSHVKWFV